MAVLSSKSRDFLAPGDPTLRASPTGFRYIQDCLGIMEGSVGSASCREGAERPEEKKAPGPQ